MLNDAVCDGSACVGAGTAVVAGAGAATWPLGTGGAAPPAGPVLKFAGLTDGGLTGVIGVAGVGASGSGIASPAGVAAALRLALDFFCVAALYRFVSKGLP